MKTILVPTDFSEAADNALAYAVQLFTEERCEIVVLNTYTPVALYATVYDYQTTFPTDLGDVYEATSQGKIHAAINAVKERFPETKHTFKALSAYNTLQNEIEQLVSTIDFECIVMGTKGASGLKEVFLGSQTMQIIKHSTIPVIGVPVHFKFTHLKDVLFATDYHMGTDQTGLSLVETLCAQHVSRLIFLNAYYGVALNDEQLKNKEALDAYFKRDAHLMEIADGMDVLEAIDDFQSKHKIDLLVLVHHKHNFFENLLFTPVVKKIVHHAEVPFLILPPK